MKNNTNLIAISGKINSGKDTVGMIIRYLCFLDYHNFEHSEAKFNAFINSGNSLYGKYEIKKFADKLKDIVCILLGCTREQLEDREFKEKELGEEWGGFQVSWDCPSTEWEGFFVTKQEAVEYLKNHGANDDDFNELDLIREIKLTPRKILQLLGTECGRQIIHPNIWINSTFSDYKLNSNWIITDCRYKNEAKAVRDRGGILIRVNGPNMFDSAIKSLNIEHISETDLDDYKFDYIIDNNETIEDLILNVKSILIGEGIING